jgi:two-component system sensor histidine kinase YesM
MLFPSSGNGYIIDEASDALINFSYIDSLDWYIVTSIPLNILFKKIHSLKQNYFVTFSSFMGAFILIAFMISYTVTRPLSHMQMKMREAVLKDLKMRLPENKYKGEILELSRTFNTILSVFV